jgi:outer membrane immunogenic protein
LEEQLTRKIILAALAMAAFSTPAIAQDGTTFHPYVGALAGYDRVSIKHGGHEGDLMYGALAGVDADVSPNVVLGVEAELSDSNVSTSARDVLVLGDRARLSAGRDIYVGGRAAYRVAPNTLLYVKAGYTNARAKARYTDATGTTSGSKNLDGYRLGAGVEFGFRGVRLRGEYRYSNYENLDSGLGFNVDTKRNQLVAAMLFGF